MATVIQPVEAQLDPRRWWALGALVASMLVLGFDMTILNVALPTMAEQLEASTGELQWIVDSYIVVFAALMLPAGLLGDRFGRRRMLIAGLLVFLVGALLGTLVGTPALLIAARTVMGVGAALVIPLGLSVLPSMFGPQERGKAVAAVTASMAAGMPLGPLVGGLLLDHYWWGSIFLINIPMVAIGIAACLFLLPESRDPASPRVDVLSTAFSAVGLGALVFGIIEAPERGWGSPLVVGSFTASAVLLAALVVRERRAPRPMLDLKLLSHRGFLFNSLAATLGTFVFSGLLFMLPTYLQEIGGNDAFGTGVRLLPLMAGLMVSARASTALVQRLGPRPVVTAGLTVLCFAALLGARTAPDSGYAFTALWLTIAGLGFGLAMVPAMDAALGGIPADEAGSGSGLLMTLRQVGGAIGIALLGSLLAGAYDDRLDTTGLPARAAEAAHDSLTGAHLVAERLGLPRLAASADAAYVDGMGTVLAVCGIAALVAALLTAALLPNVRPAGSAGPDGERPVEAEPGDRPAPDPAQEDPAEPGDPADPAEADVARHGTHDRQ
ncbi:DHA2 family efflux MFS transporter permease subunit [Streptomyces albicerus]|uniref:DHA2 family efflux MFS transporter permease subunit n=1 Tax=Streptomyces albicerus TaxID=2569859 RepID=UPI00124B0E35|nr:DHA2 family efflux MFS transporter permease subunit [Streptomyces albicerus]